MPTLWLCGNTKEVWKADDKAARYAKGVGCRKVPEYIQSAYNGFKEAVSTEYLPICGMNEITLCYLLASLAYKCKDYDNARKNISLIVVSKAASDTIKKKARILLEHVIEEEQNKTVD